MPRFAATMVALCGCPSGASGTSRNSMDPSLRSVPSTRVETDPRVGASHRKTPALGVYAVTRFASLLALLFALLLAAPEPSQAAEPVPAPAPDPTPAERFQTLTKEAEVHYAAGRFQGAIDSYLAAYEAVPSADVLYNIGYIFETNMKKPDLATDFYRRVVRDPGSTADLVTLATGRIRAIESAAALADARPKMLDGGPTNVNKGSEVGASKPSVVPWVLTGVGAAALVTGVILATMASSDHDDFQAHVGGLEGMRDNASSGKTLAVAGDALWIGGAALATTGVLWLLLRDGEASPQATGFMLSPTAGPDGAGVTLRAGF